MLRAVAVAGGWRCLRHRARGSRLGWRCNGQARGAACARRCVATDARDDWLEHVPFDASALAGWRLDKAVQAVLSAPAPDDEAAATAAASGSAVGPGSSTGGGGRAVSRAVVQRLLKAGSVLDQDGRPLKASSRVSPDGPEALQVDWRAVADGGGGGGTSAGGAWSRDEEAAAAGAVHVLFEDEHLMVVNKPAGVVVHPGAGVSRGTLLQQVLQRCSGPDAQLPRDAGGGGLLECDAYDGFGDFPAEPRDVNHYPGIVHRLDRETSGVLALAKTHAAYAGLRAQFAARGNVIKEYVTVVHGVPAPASGTIDAPIRRHPHAYRKFTAVSSPPPRRPPPTFAPRPSGSGDRAPVAPDEFAAIGKVASTWYATEVAGGLGGDASPVAVLRLRIASGRTHQIRVHAADVLGCPVVGDRLYGGSRRQQRRRRDGATAAMRGILDGLDCAGGRHLLHAHRLGFDHPCSGEPLCVEAPLPACIGDVWAALPAADGEAVAGS